MATHPQTFWSKVNARGTGDDGCWHWTAAKDKDGYGLFLLDGKLTGAHRVAWELARGPIPEGARVLHICFSKGCVNPDHLELSTERKIVREQLTQRVGAKLDAEEVAVIRAQLKLRVSQTYLAEQYGVTKQTISRIKNGETWKDVQ